MAFEPYKAGGLTGIESAFSSRQEEGLVCVLKGTDGVVHISFNSTREPGFYSQLIVHVTPQGGIRAEGYKGEFDKHGAFTGNRRPIDTAVLGKFLKKYDPSGLPDSVEKYDPSGLPDSVKPLYMLAVGYGEIKLNSDQHTNR